jgi:hypothetical protein
MHGTVSAGETVARLFKTERDAQQAVTQLRAAGFPDVRVSERSGHTFQQHVDAIDGQTAVDFAASLAGAGFTADAAQRLTHGIEHGHTLVIVAAGARVTDAEAVFEGRPVAAKPLAPVDARPPVEPASSSAPASTQELPGAEASAETRLDPGDRVVQTHGEVLDIEKRPAQSEARVRRETVTEQRTITVPVQHEELVVERDGAAPVRIPVGQDEDPRTGAPP